MQIAHSTDIGLRALIVLAERGNDLTTAAQLARELGVPDRYMARIVQRLATAGWVATTRGRGGGLRALDAGRQANVAQVIGLFEESRRAVECDRPLCPLLYGNCRLRTKLIEAEDAFMASMAAITVADLV